MHKTLQYKSKESSSAQIVSLYRCSADGHSDPRAAYGELITQEEKINDFQRKENRDHAGIWP